MVSSPNKKDKQKALVGESAKTKKAREKLERQLEGYDAKITKEALEKKTMEIHQRISRYADQRVVLRAKSISLFDENQNAAESSQKIAKIAEKIQKNFQSE